MNIENLFKIDWLVQVCALSNRHEIFFPLQKHAKLSGNVLPLQNAGGNYLAYAHKVTKSDRLAVGQRQRLVQSCFSSFAFLNEFRSIVVARIKSSIDCSVAAIFVYSSKGYLVLAAVFNLLDVESAIIFWTIGPA
jgi:hypothetical protein